MKHTHNHQKELLIALGVVLTLANISFLAHTLVSDENESLRSAAPNESSVMRSDDPVERTAARMKRRLEASGKRFTVAQLTRALREREALGTRMISVTTSDGHVSTDWTVDMRNHADVLEFKTNAGYPRFAVSAETIMNDIASGMIPESDPVGDVLADDFETVGGILKATTNDVARAGFAYDISHADMIANALMRNETGSLMLTAQRREPIVQVKDERGVRTLTLLASGLSNFEKSPDNREANVLKALSEHVNNTLVKPNATFSFNSTLNGPVTIERGWREALGLFGGGAAMTPGGGICQAATTVYRAALLAGLPIVERRNHSLYVSYYEKHGVGIDATIFPGVHDLVFRNDTKDVLLVQAYADGKDAYVNIYGEDDGRRVTLDGPYFVNTRPRNDMLRPLGYEEIGWVRTVTHANGDEKTQSLISHYAKSIPYNRLSKEYAASVIGDGFHAAATPVED